MLETLAGLPEQCEEALKLGGEAPLPSLQKDPRQVVMAGLGGSAIGGDLVRAVVAQEAGTPVLVCRDYTLPSYINEETLVFLTSYSGNTEETLSAYEAAGKQGAARIVFTTGGKLAERAQRDGVPVIRVPAGLPPRSALGYLFLPALFILGRLGLVTLREGYGELAEVLRKLRAQFEPASPRERNRAKDLALRLYGRIPVIYGAAHTTEVAATRWKGQFNENSKCLAYWNAFPEMNHNEIVGFEAPPEALRSLFLIFLRDAGDHPRVRARMEITKHLLQDRVAGVAEFWGEGSSLLVRLFSLIYLGDYASVYLALLYGINPKPVAVIDYLKQELARLS
jgi:glucose/mannose-6-phosphate isomerase